MAEERDGEKEGWRWVLAERCERGRRVSSGEEREGEEEEGVGGRGSEGRREGREAYKEDGGGGRRRWLVYQLIG